jgi:GT2 family glycosyltransferase
VLKACVHIDAEIIVIDNHSDDGSKAFFNNRFPTVKFIWLDENSGFAKANNLALKLVKGEKILFLNPDTILPEDCFKKCLDFFDTQKDIGALGVRMIDGSGKYLPESKRGFPSLFTSFCKMSGLTRRFPQSKLFANYYHGHLPENKVNAVDVLAGAFMMINKKVLDEVGSFDEAFFMYAEDIDLSYRIQKAGYKNYYFADTTIIHFKGESTKKETNQYIHIFYGAMQLFVKKHCGKVRSAVYSLMIRVAMAVKAFFRRVTKIIKEQPASKAMKYSSGNAFVISDDNTFKNIQQALLRNFNTVENVNNIKAITSTGATVVLCEGALSFKEMINLLEQHQQQRIFFIHADGTESIVGSSDKNTSGDFIVIN